MNKKLNNNEIEKIVEILKNGRVGIFPTDTVYGIGSLPLKKSVEKIYEIKKRDYSKKIIALISSKNKLINLIDKNENIEKIVDVIDKFWPGELSIIFKANKNFTKNFDDELETIGVRIPKNEITLEIIEKCGGILLTTSANLSGEEAVTEIEKINKSVLEKVDFILEEKNIKLSGKPSTIIKFENGKVELLREGNILIEEIEKLLKK